MKKLMFLISLTICTFSFLQAQQISNADILKNKPVKPIRSNQTKTTPSQPASQTPVSIYTLTAARVNIRTGADNKEYPSGVIVWLFSLGGGFTLDQPAENLRNEMKINSNTEFGLQNNPKNDPKFRTLEAFQKTGLGLRIRYMPNLPTDAWKIEGISITLEFRDQFGNLHPAFGSKTIVFNNAFGFLNYWDTDIFCKTDSYFNPLTSVISRP
jgi:hypothetical protein